MFAYTLILLILFSSTVKHTAFLIFHSVYQVCILFLGFLFIIFICITFLSFCCLSCDWSCWQLISLLQMFFVAHLKEKPEALGEVLNGDRLVSAPYKLQFMVEKDSEIVCRRKLSKAEVSKFRSAVAKDYYFQMYYDDLPFWGFLGKVEKDKTDPSEEKYYLFKHLHFEIHYNKDRVIEIDAKADPNAVVDLTDDKEVEVEFMYTVRWKETTIPFESRMEKYSQSSSQPHHLEIHWFSIINSCVTVLLLTGFLATILMRVLKNDFVK